MQSTPLQERCAAVFVRLPGTTDADFARAQYLADFLGAFTVKQHYRVLNRQALLGGARA